MAWNKCRCFLEVAYLDLLKRKTVDDELHLRMSACCNIFFPPEVTRKKFKKHLTKILRE